MLIHENKNSIKRSIFNFLKGHNAVNSVFSGLLILFSFVKLNSFFPSTNIKELRPIRLKVKLDITPFDNMHTGKHFGRLSNHHVKLIPCLTQRVEVECIRCAFLILGNDLIPNRTEIVIVCVVNEARLSIRT